MPETVDIWNMALQDIGTRTTVTTTGENSNEAIQCNLIYAALRKELLRMAPWNCATNYANLTLITAAPGTPENPSTGAAQWQKGIPPPPWAYEYDYPSNCLRPLWIVPQFATGFASGIPITTAVTGGSPQFWNGPPVRYRVALDQPITITAATIVSGGTGYEIGDTISLDGGSGVLGQVQVLGETSGVITSIRISIGGSYLTGTTPSNPVSQDSTSGDGSGATFNLTFSSAVNRRVILTNQELAILAYLTDVDDEDIWDSMFTQAMVKALGARLVWALTGQVQQANMKLQEANAMIQAARGSDGNEGLTVNDVTPDWIRTRGTLFTSDWGWSPSQTFDWGNLLTYY